MRIRQIGFLVLAAVLAGCGHGFEGEYRQQVGSSVEVLDAFAQLGGGNAIVIGTDYWDADGIRTQYADIFVRESGSQKYLVFKKADGSEEAWRIQDADTLVKGGDLVSVTLKRIKP